MATTIIACLISAIIGAVGMGVYDFNKPPKTITNVNHTTQIQNTENSSVQRSDQGQYTIIFNGDGTNRYFNINLAGTTNINFSSKTNRKSTTNK